MKRQVNLLLASDWDKELILAWRNNPEVYRFLFSQGLHGRGAIPWREHFAWWNSHSGLMRYLVFVTDETGTRKVGYIQFADWGDGMADTGIYLGEVTLWGQGVMGEALRQGLEILKAKGFEKARADIVVGNERSIRLYERLGFQRLPQARRQGEVSYEKDLKA